MSSRIEYIDRLKGLAILAVVMGILYILCFILVTILCGDIYTVFMFHFLFFYLDM